MISKIRTSFEKYEPVGEHGYKHFAILVPVVAESLLYEVRASKLDRQPGEICFPGGLIEKGETPLECALRETEEEIGINADSIDVIAKLDSIFSTGGSQIHCYLGIVDEKATAAAGEKYVPNVEVAETFTVEIDRIMKEEPEMYTNSLRQDPDPEFPYDRVTGGKMYPWRSGTSPVPVYSMEDNNGKSRIIWGLTGRITKQFLEVLKCSD